MHIHITKIPDIRCSWRKSSLSDALDWVNLQTCTHDAHSLLHDLGIAHNQRTAQIVDLWAAEGLGRDLRANPCGIAHRNADNRDMCAQATSSSLLISSGLM